MVQTFHVPLTILLGDLNGKSLGKTGGNSKEHPVEPVNGAKGSQCIKTDTASDNGCVHHRIHLLKQIAQHQWQCKGKQQFYRLSLRHNNGFAHDQIPARSFNRSITSSIP